MQFSQKYPLYDGRDHHSLQSKMKKIKRPGKLVSVVIVVLVLGITLTILNIYELHKMREDHALHNMPYTEAKADKFATKQPILWVNAKHLESGYLKHMFAVFDRIGYAVGDADSEWDVLWSHEYPFESLAKKISDLKPHQKVNHFPGSGYITSKVSLAQTKSKYIPKAFKIPTEKENFLNYTKKYPDKLWVQKNNNHRGIKIKKVDELDLSSEGSFVQQYIDKPFLIDKRKFDIGVYTIQTSIDPLRVYIVEDDALFRFCEVDYYPFDSKNVRKYVVEDNYTPVWEMPSLKKIYLDNSHTMRGAFDTYLHLQGKDYKKLWSDMKQAIVSVYLEKEPFIIKSASRFKTTRNFFELVRFDFVMDEDLNVFLMEVNMSPNLSSGHFAANKHLYEHVVYNLLRLVGITRPVINPFQKSSDDEADMRVSDREVVVFVDWCSTKDCEEDCRLEKCRLCHQCLTIEMKTNFKYAYLEHVERGSCRRVFPPSMNQTEANRWSPSTASSYYKNLNKRNKEMYMWFIGKCKQDEGWCS